MIPLSKLFNKITVKEEMSGGATVGSITASSGDISGMGYNLGGPAPDDVRIDTQAQANYAAANQAKSQPTRRRIVRRVLGNFNLGEN